MFERLELRWVYTVDAVKRRIRRHALCCFAALPPRNANNIEPYTFVTLFIQGFYMFMSCYSLLILTVV